MWAGSVAKLLVITAVTALYTGEAKARCAAPNPDAMLGQRVVGFENMLITPFRSSGSNLRWASLSGTSQMQGSVFVIDCLGRIAGDAGLGYVEKQRPGPILAGFPTLVVNYHTFSGTGIDIQSVSILQYREGKIIKLWDHPSFDGEYMPDQRQQETTWRWRFAPGNREIEVTGRDVLVLGPPKKLHRHPVAERFCLNAKATRYLPCR